MTFEEKIVLRHIYLQRYAKGLIGKSVKETRSANKELLALFRSFQATAKPTDIKAFKNNTMSNKSVRQLHKSAEQIMQNLQNNILAFTVPELEQLAKSEMAFVYKNLGEENKDRNPKFVVKKPILGQALAVAWNAKGDGNLNNVYKESIRALQENEDITQFLVGSKEVNYKDGLLNKIVNGATTLALTQVNGIANNARNQVYSDLAIQSLEIVATLDFRTTPICRYRDGKVFPLHLAPIPPYHYNCRTVVIPYVEDEEYNRPFVKDDRPVSKIPKDQRAGKIGRTKDTYAQFFAKLSAFDQREILGPKRFDLYKNKSYTLEKFVDTRSGRQYTLQELDTLTL